MQLFASADLTYTGDYYIMSRTSVFRRVRPKRDKNCIIGVETYLAVLKVRVSAHWSRCFNLTALLRTRNESLPTQQPAYVLQKYQVRRAYSVSILLA